jgi:hypothetical protein
MAVSVDSRLLLAKKLDRKTNKGINEIKREQLGFSTHAHT